MSNDVALPRVIIVDGTTLFVGKTTTVGALAAVLEHRGLRVHVVKLVQCGVDPGGVADADSIRQSLGEDVEVTTFVALAPMMPPTLAADHEGVDLPLIAQHARRVVELAQACDIVIVEGSGGLLVPLDNEGGTLADLGMVLRYKGLSVGYIVVSTVVAGAINLTALTAEALEQRGLPLIGVVIGSWPANPDKLNERYRTAVPDAAGARLLGSLPEGMSHWAPDEFRRGAIDGLDGL